MEELKIKINTGFLIATPSSDPDFPGILVEYQDQEGTRHCLVEIEDGHYDSLDTILNVYTWKKNEEDYDKKTIWF